MTTVDAPNVHAIAVEGTFDDCQNLVKAMFNHHAFRDEIGLSGVNSINWAHRGAGGLLLHLGGLARRAGAEGLSSPCRPAISAIFAGYVASAWACRSSARDRHQQQRHPGAHARDRRYEMRGVAATTSPSMDIQISSISSGCCSRPWPRRRRGAPADAVAAAIRPLRDRASPLARIRAEFDAHALDEAAVAAEIRRAGTRPAICSTRTPRSASALRAALARTRRRPRSCSAPPIRRSSRMRSKPRAASAEPLAHLADLMERKER
jgi:threonine synthase